ncbi:hypothetical protein IVB15_09210 [Bradyrhizobium sp. 182]|uniref:hypothetical protein n=1 Tax=unclassified Bradyrhizobium TaxID=2631580 RepID=UPI001FF861F2|nr:MULTISPECIES: hypothetical protein [unclassified Bradyrhizobium]MCK1422406.1 hypothetical protein [Bradyrhizobium sp. CW12]MCK1527919.1 hypothetical protein [Bradyrhizobium sp. 182]MCK1649048.1 hypothetical protein [Bradyrhizobium sp. 154]
MIRLASIALLLAGCASRGPASIASGECRIFEPPQYEVRGKRPYDLDWIDSQVEAASAALIGSGRPPSTRHQAARSPQPSRPGAPASSRGSTCSLQRWKSCAAGDRRAAGVAAAAQRDRAPARAARRRLADPPPAANGRPIPT